MAQSKIRPLMITAELKQWQLDQYNKIASGLIVNDIREFPIKDLEPIIIVNFKYVLYFPWTNKQPYPYFLVVTNVKEYFKLDLRDEKK